MDGALAIAIVIILGFVGFMVWAKTTIGQETMRRTFGEPATAQKRAGTKRTGKRPASARPASYRPAATKPRSTASPKSGGSNARSRTGRAGK